MTIKKNKSKKRPDKPRKRPEEVRRGKTRNKQFEKAIKDE